MERSANIEDLLAEQLVFVQKVLDYNKEISDLVKAGATSQTIASSKIKKQTSTISATSVATSASKESRPEVSLPIDPNKGMSQPLLAKAPPNASARGGGFGFMKILGFSTPVPPKKQPLFADPDEMKRKVKKHISKEQYNVEDRYFKTGWPQALARNESFKNFTFLVIFLNTIWIAIDTDYGSPDCPTDATNTSQGLATDCQGDFGYLVYFTLIDNLFCLYFTFEILVRYLSFKKKPNAFKDGWFVFDSILVVFMAWESWITPAMEALLGNGPQGGGISQVFRVFRLFRLTRVARLGRLLNSLPELMILLKGCVKAIRSTMSTFVLMFLIVYVFAILFTQLLGDSPAGKGRFEKVPMSMDYLMRQAFFPDQSDFIADMLAQNWAYYVSVIVYLLVASMTIMNMLIGVICDSMTSLAEDEAEDMLLETVHDHIENLLPELDADADGTVSEKEFKKMLELPTVVRSLHEVGVDVVAMVDFADFIFSDKTSLTVAEFTETVLRFRGSNQATVKDIVDIRKYIFKEMREIEHRSAH